MNWVHRPPYFSDRQNLCPVSSSLPRNFRQVLFPAVNSKLEATVARRRPLTSPSRVSRICGRFPSSAVPLPHPEIAGEIRHDLLARLLYLWRQMSSCPSRKSDTTDRRIGSEISTAAAGSGAAPGQINMSVTKTRSPSVTIDAGQAPTDARNDKYQLCTCRFHAQTGGLGTHQNADDINSRSREEAVV